MMRAGLLSLGVLVSLVGSAGAQAPTAEDIALTAGATKSVAGKLGKGTTVALNWATNSSVACFPSTRFDHFTGKHVFYTTSLPAASVLKIKAVPKKPDQDISLYAYSIGTSDKTLPPAIARVTSCEASYGSNQQNAPYNPGATEQVELNATTNPYNVVIGVAGAQGLEEGGFTLELTLTTSAAAPTGVISSATTLTAKPADTVSVKGKIDGGVRIDLAFAANSSVACFPATRFDHFDGNQVAYQFDLPKSTTATIELVPNNAKLDLSLYAYSIGTTFSHLPPNLPSVTSCEASYGTSNINEPYNPGGSEKVELVAISNPYKAYIVVAGAQKTTKGGFTLKVTLAPR